MSNVVFIFTILFVPIVLTMILQWCVTKLVRFYKRHLYVRFRTNAYRQAIREVQLEAKAEFDENQLVDMEITRRERILSH